MKLGALLNLSSVLLSCHCYWKGCGTKGLVGSGLGLVRGRTVLAVTCLGGVLASLGLAIVPRPPSPPRHWQERNRKGRAKISKVVVGWPSLARLQCLDNQLPRESTVGRNISFLHQVAC